jgi:hypothetical protein
MTYFKALTLMRKGSLLVREHSECTGEWYLHPGGKLERRVAEKLLENPQVCGNRDGIWPGHDQTWRIDGGAA